MNALWAHYGCIMSTFGYLDMSPHGWRRTRLTSFNSGYPSSAPAAFSFCTGLPVACSMVVLSFDERFLHSLTLGRNDRRRVRSVEMTGDGCARSK